MAASDHFEVSAFALAAIFHNLKTLGKKVKLHLEKFLHPLVEQSVKESTNSDPLIHVLSPCEVLIECFVQFYSDSYWPTVICSSDKDILDVFNNLLLPNLNENPNLSTNQFQF